MEESLFEYGDYIIVKRPDSKFEHYKIDEVQEKDEQVVLAHVDKTEVCDGEEVPIIKKIGLEELTESVNNGRIAHLKDPLEALYYVDGGE